MDYDKIKEVLRRLSNVKHSNMTLGDMVAIEHAEELIHSLRAECGNQETRIVDLEQAQPEWQPIDTAPRDGKRFIAWFPKDGVDFCHWQKSEYGDMPEGWRDSFITVYREGWEECPTHWMPLPEPPK